MALTPAEWAGLGWAAEARLSLGHPDGCGVSGNAV